MAPRHRAAAALAKHFVGPSVTVSDASTGRCNLHATDLGLLMVDRDRVDAGNRISESITVATLPPYSLVPPNAMIATVKVIASSTTTHADGLTIRPETIDRIPTPIHPCTYVERSSESR